MEYKFLFSNCNSRIFFTTLQYTSTCLRLDALIYQDCAERPRAQHQQSHHSHWACHFCQSHQQSHHSHWACHFCQSHQHWQSLLTLNITRFDALDIWRSSSVLISEFPLHWDRWFCFVIPQNTLGFLLHWRHFDTDRLCNCNITINKLHKILETNLSNGKKYMFVFHAVFL